METITFLQENREEVINFYNNEIKGFWAISLNEFMLDLLNNFKKITAGEEFKKFDLCGNLQSAKSRLGLFNACEVQAIDKKTNYLKNKYNGTSAMALV